MTATLYGYVESSGVVASGTGFMVTRTSTGTYTISFNDDFETLPAIVINPVDADNGLDGAYPLNITLGSCDVITTEKGGHRHDYDFAFIMMG